MKTRRHNNCHKVGFIALLCSLIGLGTTGCYPCMYGSLTADFSAKGRVIDEDGQPIQGLQVTLGHRWHGENYDGTSYKPIDSLKTGPNGEYEVFFASTIPILNLQVDVNDIDGEANGGNFESATVLVKDIQYENGKGWYEGEAAVEVPDIKLKKK